jgi:predicted RNase H-like HicB family nuclease
VFKGLTKLRWSVNAVVFGVGWTTKARGSDMASRDEVHGILEGFDFRMKYRQTDSGWWIAYCEEVPEARTQGATKDEVKENLKDAIAFILEDYSVEELERFRNNLASEESELLAL